MYRVAAFIKDLGGECITAEDPELQDVLTDERKITLRR